MASGGQRRSNRFPVSTALFAALATLIGLGVLGIAIGLSSFDANNVTRSLGIGAGIWGAISALLAFLVGGWIVRDIVG